MITIGGDYHKRTSTYRFLNDTGETIEKRKIENDPEQIKELLTSLSGPKRLAMEATRSWGLYYDYVKNLVDEFWLGKNEGYGKFRNKKR